MIRPNQTDRRANIEASKIIDLKLPLSWLIALAISFVGGVAWVVWQATALSNKVDLLIVAQVKAEKRAEEKDARTERLRDDVSDLRRATDLNTLRISTLERLPSK